MGTSKGEEDAQVQEGETEEELKKDETSGSLPTYQYSRDELLKIAEHQASKTRPACLSKEFDNGDGVWDPEKWVRSLHDSREASPLPGTEDRDRKRSANLDREPGRKRPQGLPHPDVKERLKEERDTTIVLSPQRRSFGTGCHVSTSLSRQLSGGDYKESSERDRERREQRRIGSGRLNMDRDTRGVERDFRTIRFERDPGRYERDRFRRDAEDRDRDKDRDRDRDKRDFRSSYGGNSRRRQYSQHEEQPEWFTEGPTSQSDTIELRGFKGASEEQKKKKKTDEEPKEEGGKEDAHAEDKDKQNAVGVGESNGMVETDSGSPEAVQQDAESKLFDFNTFFRLNDLPGLPGSDSLEATVESRFSRFFYKNNSRENSRRNSFENEFGYIHEMIDGKRSPGGASPTSPGGQPNFAPLFPSAIGEKPSAQLKSRSSPLLQSLFNNSSSSGDKGNGACAPSFNIQDVEAQLKAMLLGGKKDSASSSGTASPASSSSNLMRKGKTVAELEAEIHQKTRETSDMSGERSASSQSAREKTDDGDSSAFNKLLSLMKAGAAAPAAGVTDPLRQQITDDMRTISPASRVSQPAHNEFMNALMRNKEQQLHLQQQSLQQQSLQQQQQQLRIQQQALLQQAQQQQQILQQQSLLQAHQQNILQQHQQQQQQQQLANFHRGAVDSLAGFMNPSIITKPPSPATRLPTVLPTTPQMNSPTPTSIPAAFLAKQGQVQASSARVPSPIMFGQQPPSHLSAPSPIHPIPRPLSGQGQALAPNTLGVSHLDGPQGNVRPGRVLSPQDLVLHTQAIMQNALIKKQLEDQKERFMKKQQERARSPSVTNVPGGQARPASATSIPGTPTPGQNKTVSVAFTPTSVIKKMHSDRVTEKEKSTKTDADGDSQDQGQVQGKADQKPGDKLPPLSGPGGDTAAREALANRSNNTVQDGGKEGEMPRVNGPTSSQTLLKLPGAAAELGQPIDHNVNNAPSTQAGMEPSSLEFNLASQLMGLAGNDKPKQARALVGQGTMQNAPAAAQNQQPPIQGRPIVKAAAPPMPPSSSPNPSAMNATALPRPLVGAPVSRADMPGQRPIIGTGGGGGGMGGGMGMGGQPTGGISLDIHKLMEQQRMLQQARQAVNPQLPVRHPIVSSAPFGMPITGRMPLQAGVVPPTTAQQAAAGNPLLMQQLMQGGRVNPLHPFNQMAARQAAQQQRMVDPRLQLQGVRGFNGPLSPNRPGFSPFAALGQNANNSSTSTSNTNNNSSSGAGATKQGDSSLLKWLGPDFVNQFPNCPPVPTPGHQVMTVDEIERSQQAVKN